MSCSRATNLYDFISDIEPFSLKIKTIFANFLAVGYFQSQKRLYNHQCAPRMWLYSKRCGYIAQNPHLFHFNVTTSLLTTSFFEGAISAIPTSLIPTYILESIIQPYHHLHHHLHHSLHHNLHSHYPSCQSAIMTTYPNSSSASAIIPISNPFPPQP